MLGHPRPPGRYLEPSKLTALLQRFLSSGPLLCVEKVSMMRESGHVLSGSPKANNYLNSDWLKSPKTNTSTCNDCPYLCLRAVRNYCYRTRCGTRIVPGKAERVENGRFRRGKSLAESQSTTILGAVVKVNPLSKSLVRRTIIRKNFTVHLQLQFTKPV